MIRKIFIIGLVSLSTLGISQIPSGYYNVATNLDGDELRTALEGIIDGHTNAGYDNLWNHFQTTDRKSNAKVWDMYSDKPSGTSSYEYSFGSGKCGEYSAEGDCFNREHSFPKSWFNDASPMNSDLFHIYPTDGWVNGKRSNYAYGEVGSASWTGTNGSKVGSSNFSGYSGTVFEPIDEYKGDFARTYFYMVTRYKSNASGWNSDMLSGNNLSTWAISLLLKWADEDPVSQKEIDRNNAVHDIQGNRNPFIDNILYKEYIWRGKVAGITGLSTTTAKLTVSNNVISLETNSTSTTSNLYLYSIVGNLIKAYTVDGNFQKYDLNGLTKGVYIARFDKINKKLIIQ